MELARLEGEMMLELTYPCPQDSPVIENVADAVGVAVSATQRNTLLVMLNPVPIVESFDALSHADPPVPFRRVRVAATVNDLETTSYQYIKEEIKENGRHTIEKSIPPSKHPPASFMKKNYFLAIAAVGLYSRYEDEDFVYWEVALIKGDARDHMTVTVMVTLGHAYYPRPSLDIWTLPLFGAAIDPRRRGTKRSSSSPCHSTPYRIRISRRFKISSVDKWMSCSRKSAPKFARALRPHQIRYPSILRVVQTNNCSSASYTHPPFASGYPYPYSHSRRHRSSLIALVKHATRPCFLSH
ncbi:hypothetical protein JOM56_015127 [Amanita muscaria]